MFGEKTWVHAKALCCASGGLIALLETAAVRHATENPWNELRIIHVAEAEENLVLCR